MGAWLGCQAWRNLQDCVFKLLCFPWNSYLLTSIFSCYHFSWVLWKWVCCWLMHLFLLSLKFMQSTDQSTSFWVEIHGELLIFMFCRWIFISVRSPYFSMLSIYCLLLIVDTMVLLLATSNFCSARLLPVRDGLCLSCSFILWNKSPSTTVAVWILWGRNTKLRACWENSSWRSVQHW